jgi:ribosomal protein L11 methyltransferase
MTYQPVQIIARGPRAEAEAAAAQAEETPGCDACAFSILEEDEDRNVWRIDAFPTSEEEAAAFKAVMDGFAALTTTVETLADADWLAMALSGLPPVRAGRFFIYGAHDRGAVPVNTVALRIEAGAAFGTGHHGTTTGCLLAFDRLLKSHARFERVLDIGTGTGVLAIAAKKCGSRVAVGTDIDPVSVRIAQENAEINQARARMVHADGLDHRAVRQDAPYDLVFANILARPLVSLASPIREALKPGGVAILSGLLRSQERMVLAAYLSRGYRLVFRIRRDAWACLVVQRVD